jgi:acyl carrier protein
MPSTDEIRSALAEILQEIADVQPDAVEDSKSFTDDLGVDSLSMMEVVMAAQDKFDVEIPDADVEQLKTVGDAVSYIAAKLP